MRIIIYTGKGGVGKTSVAAATAVKLAKQGKRTLVLSTDAAHSLADSLGTVIGPDPVPISENLWGQEVNSLRETERNWGAVQGWLTTLLDKAQLTDITTEEMLVFPGMEELFSLLQIKEHAVSGQFDVLVVDCAPTGETLRLLSYPNVLNWWLEKIFPTERKLIKLVRPVAKIVNKVELPSDDVLDSVEHLARGLEEMQRIVLDPEITSVRIVVNPEKMVLAEAKRSFTYLNLFGFNTDAIVVNRVLPDEAGEGFFAHWRELQRKYENEIVENFQPLPILKAPMMPKEVIGLPVLEELADIVFGTEDPFAKLYQGRTELIREVDGELHLELMIPFVDKAALDLTQTGDELTVNAGDYKRKVILPRVLMGRQVTGAKYAEDRLIIRFSAREGAAQH
ncbi:ArsA family ATPase [Brevibacillus brevis]|uniref:ArsA family ATPase n=1 Tax=Brevibacillus brevis TaxID=1393 RepID=UPI000D10D786|nr:ArsA family ATPase [Brevibacillus brevis]PSJ67783.1 arsenic-transporting ATPase [Brevibacillus brevis]RED22827.1 arsenite efflux ATP-binding protein ArsA [Brevibacillus brevis]GEC92877.1 arsenic-transporting ATPase [Brevibacillus brevis]VEF87700.1 Arsenical pump-driving ATPase [Brevibacillus brevis]